MGRLTVFLSLTVAILVAAVGRGVAQERITLSSAETVANTDYEIVTVTLDNAEGRIDIRMRGVQNNAQVRCEYNANTNPTGAFLLAALNKANLSTAYANNATTGSLKQRIYHRLFSGGMNEGPAVCGKSLTGTLTGSVP